MKRLFILCLLAIPIQIGLTSFSSLERQVVWKKGQPLKWKQFRTVRDDNSSNKALTKSGITYSYKFDGEKLHFKCYAYFDPTGSWVKRGHKTDYILKHEQGHFDITEIYARKLRKAFLNLHFTERNYQRKIKEIYKKTTNEWLAEQSRYDRESRHSIAKETQKAWNMLIKGTLEELEDYTDINLTAKVSTYSNRP